MKAWNSGNERGKQKLKVISLKPKKMKKFKMVRTKILFFTSQYWYHKNSRQWTENSRKLDMDNVNSRRKKMTLSRKKRASLNPKKLFV